MDAGSGASEQARRLARRADRLRDELARAERQQRAWEAGAEGERLTADALSKLPGGDWRVLHDVRWPGRPRANIDHIAIGPPGVFVLDSKNWSGNVVVRDGVLRQNGYRRVRETTAVADAANAVTSLLAPHVRTRLHPVLVLTGTSLPATRTTEGVTVCGRPELLDVLLSLPIVLDAEEIPALSRRLVGWLDDVTSPELLTSGALADLPPARHEPAARTRRAHHQGYQRQRRAPSVVPALQRRSADAKRLTVVIAILFVVLVILRALGSAIA